MGISESHPFFGKKESMSELIKQRMQIIEECNSVQHDNWHPEDDKNEDEYRNKTWGCLVGAMIGDASGVLVKGAYTISKEQADFAMSMHENEGPFYFAPG